MNPPSFLYRYRSFDVHAARETEALLGSYLFASTFASMNDPMEAFIETGGPEDRILKHFAPGVALDTLYGAIVPMVAKFGLISFSETFEDLPLWAYYAGNFSGLCLEFDTARLAMSPLRSERLFKVEYETTALPPISLSAIMANNADDVLTARLVRKRREWAHEKEWRYVTGRSGEKPVLDDALTRIFLGPRMPPAKVNQICTAMARRPVEILMGEGNGFDLRFRTLQERPPFNLCERVGSGRFDVVDNLYAAEDLRAFLDVPCERLVDECRRLAEHPNMERFHEIDLAGPTRDVLFVWTEYALRDGTTIPVQRYYDQGMQLLER